MSNQELWAIDRKKHDLKYPDENVIRFLYSIRSQLNGNKILDFGCGSGRNTKAMVDMGFDTYAMDYNDACIELTKEKCGEKVHYLKNEELDIPLEDDTMDGIVAWGALFYLSHDRERILPEKLVKVLKPGGMLLADFRTKDDSLYGKGEAIEEDFYILDESCGSLAGITYAFKDLENLKRLFEEVGMVIENYEKIDHYAGNMRTCNSHYIIWAKKEDGQNG